MMDGFTVASGREINLFMRNYCRNERARLSLAVRFRVEVEVYEELAPGQQVYSWACGGRLIGGAVLMLKVKDMEQRKLYYPVFSAGMGRRLLRSWELPLPPCWSIYVRSREQGEKLNLQLRHLLAYARVFGAWQRSLAVPLPYGFREIFLLLHDFPQQTVDYSVIALVNDVLRQQQSLAGGCAARRHLQEFISFLHGRHTLLRFVDADFSALRWLLDSGEATETSCF